MAIQSLTVKGMSCSSCVAGIEGNVGKIEGVKQVKVLLDEGKVDVEYDGGGTTLDQIKSTIQDQGYEVTA